MSTSGSGTGGMASGAGGMTSGTGGMGSGTGGMTSGAGGSSSVCGDGKMDPGEECDDNNVLPADGCAADCTLEDPETCPGPSILLTQAGFTVMGDTQGASNDSGALPCGGSASGDLIYSVTPDQDGTLTATLTGNFSVLLYARAECPGMNNMDLACSGMSMPASISIPVQKNKTVFLFVDGRGPQASEGPFTLTLALQ